MDPENVGKETIVKVTGWLRGIWEMRRRAGPVQQWVDSIPSPIKSNLAIANQRQGASTEATTPATPSEPKDIPFSMGTNPAAMTVSAPINVPNVPVINTPGLPSSLPHKLVRDPSLQSDSSHCSSVESLLELRKADPEAILLGLGFGGCAGSPQENGTLSRIPKRFLQPSKLKGIAINDFVKHQQETSESFDSVSLGYRGLTGSPYVAPSEIVQKIMERLREHESHDQDPQNSYEQYSPLQHNGTFSVLSPDNRQFLERPRSKSPDMRNKRIIIGQKSFAFGHDGDLIEIKPDAKSSESVNSIAENSEIFRNLNGTNTDRDKIAIVQSTEKIVPKLLLFDDSIELSDTDVNSPMQTSEEHSDTRNASLEKEDIFLSTLPQNVSDARRASDGSCDVKPGESLLLGRRHSDSFVHALGDRESVLSQRRKTLRRQSRVSDMDAINLDTRTCSDTVESRESNSCGDNIRCLDIASRNDSENCGAECSSAIPKETDCVQSVDSNAVNENQTDSECSVETSQTIRAHKDKATCCCPGTTKCWAKVDKIIKKNKNLESMVVRNRREMAEIREMLSSVLSVRMEPGF